MTPHKLDRHIQLECRLAEQLERYSGQWVAVCDHIVIAHAQTATKLDQRLADEKKSYRTFRVTRGGGATLL